VKKKDYTGQQKNTFCIKRKYDNFFSGCWFQIWHLFSCGTSNFGVTAKGFFGYI